MKSYEELQKEYKYHKEKANKLLDQITRHSEFIKHYFEKLDIKDEDTYLKELINRLNLVNCWWSSFTFTMDGKHYMVKPYIYDGTYVESEFYYGGEQEKSEEEYQYKEYRSIKLKNDVVIIKKYFGSKRDSKYLNKLLKESDLPDFVKVGIMLILTKLIRSK